MPGRPRGISKSELSGKRCQTAAKASVAGLIGRRGVAFSTRNLLCCIAVAIAVGPTQPAFALDPSYPDWPCQQLKVPGISIASVWTGPPIEAIDKENSKDPKEAELVARLAARRTPIEDARKLIADFVVGTNDQKQEKAKRLFAALYSTLNAQRDQVMDGIERFSRKQKAMAEEIREQTRKMRELQDRPERQSSAEAMISSVNFRGKRGFSRIGENRLHTSATCLSLSRSGCLIWAKRSRAT